MIRLEAGRHPLLQSDRVAELGDDAAFLCDENQILDAADLGHRGDDLRRQAGRECRERALARLIRQEPIPEASYRQMRDGLEGARIVLVDDETRYLIA